MRWGREEGQQRALDESSGARSDRTPADKELQNMLQDHHTKGQGHWDVHPPTASFLGSRSPKPLISQYIHLPPSEDQVPTAGEYPQVEKCRKIWAVWELSADGLQLGQEDTVRRSPVVCDREGEGAAQETIFSHEHLPSLPGSDTPSSSIAAWNPCGYQSPDF